MIFGEHDLGARAPFPRIDLILCRNVLIYFNLPMQRAALETFGFSLATDGRLVLGPSRPSPPCRGRSSRTTAGCGSTGDCPGISAAAQPWPRLVQPAPGSEVPLRRAIRPTRRGRPDRRRADRGRRGVAARPRALGVVVVDPRYYITRINTAARRMLGIHGAAFDQDFIHLAESLPSSAVRAAIDAALTGKTSRAVHEVEAADVAADGARVTRDGHRARTPGRAGARHGGRHRADRHHPARTRSARPRADPAAAGQGGRCSTTACCAPTTS